MLRLIAAASVAFAVRWPSPPPYTVCDPCQLPSHSRRAHNPRHPRPSQALLEARRAKQAASHNRLISALYPTPADKAARQLEIQKEEGAFMHAREAEK